jgi:hypothetical protein
MELYEQFLPLHAGEKQELWGSTFQILGQKGKFWECSPFVSLRLSWRGHRPTVVSFEAAGLILQRKLGWGPF